MSESDETAATREVARMGFEALKPALSAWSDEELHALLAATLGVTGDRARWKAAEADEGRALKLSLGLARRGHL